jgi:hypothetical protein
VIQLWIVVLPHVFCMTKMVRGVMRCVCEAEVFGMVECADHDIG